jgi:DNA-binding MarR family transcriptional regulator
MAVTHVTDGPATSGDGLGCRVQRLARLHRTALRDLLEEAGLYPGQEQLLLSLWAGGPQTQAALAASLDLDASTICKTLQRLERAGLVARDRCDGDRRAIEVSTTDAGDALRPRVAALLAEADERITRGLTAAERDTLSGLLDRLDANLRP